MRAAIDIAGGDGLAAVSMRRIADRLGAGPMSLYTYVPGKAELVDVMVDTVTGQVVLPSPVQGPAGAAELGALSQASVVAGGVGEQAGAGAERGREV